MPWAMTAHVIYNLIEPSCPVTHSARVIHDLIRTKFGFDGVLISDDVSMNALTGTLRERTEKALSAGCDLALHCNGEMDEMILVSEGAGKLTDKGKVRMVNAERLRKATFEEPPFFNPPNRS